MRKVTKMSEDITLDSTGKRIAFHRTHKGLSQQELADKLLIKRQMLNMIENGNRDPSIQVLKGLAAELEVSTDYLLGLSKIPKGSAEDKAIEERLGLTKGATENLENLKSEFGETVNVLIASDKLKKLLELIQDLSLLRINTMLLNSVASDYDRKFPESDVILNNRATKAISTQSYLEEFYKREQMSLELEDHVYGLIKETSVFFYEVQRLAEGIAENVANDESVIKEVMQTMVVNYHDTEYLNEERNISIISVSQMREAKQQRQAMQKKTNFTTEQVTGGAQNAK